MKLYFSSASPFVRKVSICAAELGLALERVPSKVAPVERDRTVVAINPLGQVPTLVADDGTILYDSRVICEYLDEKAGGGKLFPKSGATRWQALVEQSASDGILDAGILVRYETFLRPGELQWKAWIGGQMEKITGACDSLEHWAPSFGSRVDIGTISAACALGWLDFRFADLGWRNGRKALASWFEKFEARPSMTATKPST